VEITVVDDIISAEYQDKILSLVRDYRFTWHFTPSNIYETDNNRDQCFVDNNTVDSYQFTHLMLNSQIKFKEPFYDNFVELIDQIQKQFNLLQTTATRVKANLLTNNRHFDPNSYNPPHVDGDYEHWVVVYYVDDSDGDTVVFNETYGTQFDKLTVKQRISPKKGRAICFPGKYFHASSNPITNGVRTVFNIDFKSTDKIIL
jgi:hypothetical protein